MSWLGRWRQSIANGVVNLGQGSTPHSSLDSPKAFRIIVAIGLITIGGSFWLIWHDIHSATRTPIAKQNSNTPTTAQLDALKSKDTDGDGISDYQELYVTHTSPYLKDSDGDGVSDADELKAGTDPNCPQGKICSSFSLLTSPTDANGNITPAFLRAALKAAGVPQSQLDQTDDASLLAIYRQVAGTSSLPTNTNANSNTNQSATNTSTNSSTSSSLSDLNNLTPTQIRQLLVQNGVDSTTLEGVSDATLQQIFQQAVQSSQ